MSTDDDRVDRRRGRSPLRLPSVHPARPARAGRVAEHDRRRAAARASRTSTGAATSTAWPASGASTSATAGSSSPRRCAARRAARLLPRVLVDGNGHAGTARRAADRAGAAGDVEGVLRLHRLRRERHPGEARLVLQQRARPAGEEEDHRA